MYICIYNYVQCRKLFLKLLLCSKHVEKTLNKPALLIYLENSLQQMAFKRDNWKSFTKPAGHLQLERGSHFEII